MSQKLSDEKVQGYEVVVVNDGFTDLTLDWLAQSKHKLPLIIKLSA